MAKLTEERRKAITACTNVTKYIRDTQFEVRPMQAMMVVDNFWHTMGDKSMIDLDAYIMWARKHGEPETQISFTVAHDLSGAGTRCFLPRSDGYAETLEEFMKESKEA